MGKITVIAFLALIAATGWAADEEVSYDNLVSELSRARSPSPDLDPLENVKFHLGVGIANTVSTLKHTDTRSTYISQRGVQATFGIDLFSRHWLSEFTVGTFGETNYERSIVSLREFGMRLTYLGDIDNSTLYYRISGGVGARYMKARFRSNVLISNPGAESALEERWVEENYSTPSSILVGGIGASLSRSIGIGVDVLARNSLTNETPDQSSFDFVVRLDGQF